MESLYQEGGKHLLRLIDEILDMSKIEADKVKLEIIEFLVKDIVESSLLLFIIYNNV